MELSQTFTTKHILGVSGKKIRQKKPEDSEWGIMRVIKTRLKEERHSQRKSKYLVWKGTRTDEGEPWSLSINLYRSLNLKQTRSRLCRMGPEGSAETSVYVCATVEQLQPGNLLWSLVTAQRRIVAVFEEGLLEVSLGNTVCYEPHIHYEHSDYLLTSLFFQIKSKKKWHRDRSMSSPPMGVPLSAKGMCVCVNTGAF